MKKLKADAAILSSSPASLLEEVLPDSNTHTASHGKDILISK